MVELPRFRLTLVREPGVRFDEAPVVTRAGEAARVVERILEGADREQMGALYLDLRSRLIGYDIAYVGTLSKVNVEPRGILVPALLCNATAVVLFHCHPSGDPTPSTLDQFATRRIVKAGEILGVRVIDHLVVGEPGRWTSMRDLGLIEPWRRGE
jgi:DNA repair protein RadC